ncbi:hypothetical protein HPB48_014046 [Haemaphysalis longicornis]|uniref:Uncharacterized protein n=1 Tax=Haemaphysalis longicornis TaxID=44386 RepID=A0A9J6GJH8_HAELO|nr:hypothetical protein HPB48_014046 [Haemaphysalis longicornis]
MVFCRNVATLLWRTLYLQAGCRHYGATTVELLTVALLFFFATGFSYKKPEPLEAPMPLPLENVSFNPVPAVVYGPSTGYTDSLMKPVIDAVTKPRQQGTSGGERGLKLWSTQRREDDC